MSFYNRQLHPETDMLRLLQNASDQRKGIPRKR